MKRTKRLLVSIALIASVPIVISGCGEQATRAAVAAGRATSNASGAGYDPGARITFTFDVVNRTLFDLGAPILAAHDMPGVLNVQTGLMGLPGETWQMTWDDIRTLQNHYAWEIGSHTVNHPYLTTLSDTGLQTELEGSKNTLEEEGLTVSTLASPFGDINNHVLAAAARYYSAHRTVWDGPNPLPPDNDYKILANEILSTTTPEQVKTWVDGAIAEHQWLVILMHDVVDRTPQGEEEYNVDDFRQVIDAVAKSGIRVVTMRQPLEYSTQPNLVSNYSFSDRDSTGWAVDWERSDAAKISVDTNSKGNVPSPVDSLKIVGSGSANTAVSKLSPVTYGKDYLLRMYENVQDRDNGGQGSWAVLMGEYDSANQWINGQWLAGHDADFVGTRYYPYSPSSPAVVGTRVHVYTEPNSKLTLYVDSVELRMIAPAQNVYLPIVAKP